jgi:FkbM family methyltransferase
LDYNWPLSTSYGIFNHMSLRKLRKVLRILPHQELRRGLKFGVGAAIEHSGFLEQQEYATVLDAGANKGQFSLIARFHSPGAQIIAFEPLDDQADVFAKVFTKDPAVTLHRYALGSATGETEINVSSSPDSSSLLPISELQTQHFPGTGLATTKTIRVKRLDDCVAPEELDSNTLLKIDVQGFELELLKGATAALERIGAVYVECSFIELYEGQALAFEVIAYLQQHGFVLRGIYNPQYDAAGVTIQADLAFSRAAE